MLVQRTLKGAAFLRDLRSIMLKPPAAKKKPVPKRETASIPPRQRLSRRCGRLSTDLPSGTDTAKT